VSDSEEIARFIESRPYEFIVVGESAEIRDNGIRFEPIEGAEE